MNKKWIFIIYITVMICILFVVISDNSFAYKYEKNNYTLFYKDDMNELENDINIYLSEIDNFLLPNATFLYSDILTENYDFLTNFAIAYIYNNKEIFYNIIVEDDNGIEFVNINELYNITDKYFGIRDFYIYDNEIKDNLIMLKQYNDVLFDGKIISVDADRQYDYIYADICYDNGDNYRYVFKVINSVLKLYNIEVLA